MANELLIKINADAKNAKKAFDDIKKQTEDLEDGLGKVALISAAAFAALTAEVYLSVHAFEEAQQASVQLSNALQNQGIFTEELKNQYEEYAKAVQAATGVDDDAVSKAQAVAQGYLGQTKITKELTFAIADLAAATGGDLNSAAEKIARTIGTGTNAFARQGLVIAEGATEAERYAKVLEFVNLKSGGLAEELNKAGGYSKSLTAAFSDFQETIGSRFAPAVAAGRKVLIGLFELFTNNPKLADFAVALIAGGLAVAGIAAAAAAAIPIFTALTAAAAAFGITLNIAFVGIPLLIGAVVAGLTLLALNWDKSMAVIVSTSKAAVVLVTELFKGLSNVLQGAFSFNPAQLKAGLAQVGEAFKKASDEGKQSYAAITEAQKVEGEKQNADKAAAAAKAAATERQHQANLQAIRQANLELLRLQNQNASAEIIALKTKEIETLKALDSEKSKAELALFQERHDQIVALEEQQNAEDFERAAAFAELQATTKAELQAQGIATDAQIREDRLTAIRATALTEADIDRQLQEQLLKSKIEQRNQELQDRKKYGATVAVLNRVLYSDEVQGAKSASSELVALQQSKNSTLKTIGKAAAVANITISTAESAMNIFKGFSTIPIVGPILGVIGAAAAVAFGAERIGQVTAAADGGLITGGIPGVDSVPALLTPGELVVPKQNFNQVVGAVRGENAPAQDNSQMVALLQSIDAKFSNPQVTTIQGDVTADDAYIDALVRKISDAVEFRNAQIFGVTG